MRSAAFCAAAAALGLVLSACGSEDFASLGEKAEAQHSWNGYHWSSSKLGPSVIDKASSTSWQVAARVQEWVDLGQPIQPAMSTATKGDVTVVQQFSNFYLGLAQIWIESGHIAKGKVSLNPVLLSAPYTPAGAAHVACQELGHVWGLDHQWVETSCMDDCQDPGLTQTEWLGCINDPGRAGPDAHDAAELADIYDHTDSTTGGSEPGAGPPCDKNPTHPTCTGASGWVTVHVFERRD